MSKKVKAVILTVSIAIVLFTIAGGLGVRAASNDGAYRQLGVYSEVLSRIRSEYVEEPNIPQVTDGALHGLLESLDPNSSYLTAAEYKQYRAHKVDGKGQIGATISKRFGYAAVISVIPGGPADKAGIENSDIFEAIEGRSTREMSLAEIQSLLAGEPGSNVNVSVVRARRAEPQKITITRNTVKIPNVSEKSLEDAIVYIKVDAFNKGKAQEIANKLKADQLKGAKKIILDLRDCAEGDEQEGIATANLFLDHGTIAYLQGQRYPRETFNADLNQGGHRPAAGGDGESRHRRPGRDRGRRHPGERARRRVGRQDFWRRLGAEGDRDPRRLGADPVHRQVLHAQRQGDPGHGDYSQHPGRR